MENLKIYILTHKQFEYEKNEIYEPLLNGSALHESDFGYTRDDTGDNISKLNPYYAELTGEYWAWKNSTADIIGFCHYRRYFVKDLSLKKLEKNDIEKILREYDIIVPQRMKLEETNLEFIEKEGMKSGTCERKEDYELLRQIIEKESPEYLKYYDQVLNEKEIFLYNMFICRKELADDYFDWVFNILEKFKEKNDFSGYGENKRVLGYLSERLINVYVKKHDLKVKEKYVSTSHMRFPRLIILENKSLTLRKIISKAVNLKNSLIK